MEGCFVFQWGGVVFQMGASFLSGGCIMGGISFGGGFSKKIIRWGGAPHAPHGLPPHYGKPCNCTGICLSGLSIGCLR